jgi:DNA-binding Lrp family transcriptional regulator
MRVAAAGKFPYLGAETQADRMDGTDKKLLNLLQTEVPIAPQPWGVVGERLGGVGEAEVMERVRALKAAKIIRQISAIFDTLSLGYESSLVAAQYDSARLDPAAAIVNAHPGVSHNYQRNHAFNLWYTIAVSPDSRLGLERTVQVLHETSGARSTRLLPTLHLFKIGVELDIEGTAKLCEKKLDGYTHKDRKTADTSLTDLEIRFVREMQKDLAIEPEPFVATASRLGVSLEELQRIAAAMIENGRMRRFSAVLRHREVMFAANAMGVWAARGTEAEILAAGEKMAAFRAVTHCYRRPTYPDWPYNLFTMVHGRTPAECEAVLAEISKETGVANHAALYSTKEYKKTRVEYFTDAEQEWERRYIAADTPKNVVK